MNQANNRKWALRANLLLLRISRRWLTIANMVITLYVTLPFAAPILMKAGLHGPGELIYTLYSPFCHQFAFRSFFLFGEQSAYPRAITGTDGQTFEEVAIESSTFRELYARHARTSPELITSQDLEAFSPALQFAARDFRGDEQIGYKITLCERDITIYLALLAGAFIYARVRKRLRPVPILIYILLGLGPIGIDGFSQLLGYPPFNLWQPRETLPIFRVVTGLLFGLMNAWLAFPYLEISFRETRELIETKLDQAGIQN